MEKKKEGKVIKINSLNGMSVLKKLQIIVSLIFILSTLAIVLIFVTNFVFAAILILISYLMVFGLTVKLLMAKKL
jgi:hypothetical protein